MDKVAKTRTMLRHEVMTKGAFSLEKDGEDMEIFGQRHILVKVVEEFDGDDWEEVDRLEEEDEFLLTDYETGYRFDDSDVYEMFGVEYADYDWNGFGTDWCGIEDDDTLEQAEEKWEEYKAKFPQLTSKDQFDID